LTDSHEASGFLRRLLEAGVDVRFADLPQIQGATGRFLLQMVAVAELEAGMISTRTKAALTAVGARSLAEGASERATASPSSSAERGPGKEPRPTASAPPIDLDPKEQRHHPAGHRRRLKRGRDFALSGTS